jgi:hypothetical protein
LASLTANSQDTVDKIEAVTFLGGCLDRLTQGENSAKISLLK